MLRSTSTSIYIIFVGFYSAQQYPDWSVSGLCLFGIWSPKGSSAPHFQALFLTLWLYHFSVTIKLFFLHKFQCTTIAIMLPVLIIIHSVLVFWYSKTKWATISSFSPNILQLLSVSSLSITFLVFLVLIACSCTDFITPSVSFFNPLLFNHPEIYSF